MALKMVSLTRNASGAYTARKGIPADIRQSHEKVYGSRREVKFYARASTPFDEARRKFAQWQSEIEDRFAGLRRAERGEGMPLTHREAHALAGEWYAWFLERHEHEPGLSGRWYETALETLKANCFVPDGYTGAATLEAVRTDPRNRDIARAHAADLGMTSAFLLERKITLTPEGRDRFLDAVVPELEMVALRLARNAEGDYSIDDRPLRHPKREPRKTGMTCWQLFEAWVRERHPKPATVDRWRGVFLHLKGHFGERDIASITSEEGIEWKDTLITPERSGKTVNEVWLNAARTVFGHAVANKKVKANPFTGVRVAYAEPVRNRDGLAFTEKEIATILRATLANHGGISRPYRAARRWVPWLCAYSGARVQEITQLRAEDVTKIGDIWAFKIKPEAGTQKKDRARTVPIHAHLIEQGFLKFVNSVGKGPLFYSAKAQAKQGASDPTNPKKSLAVKAREHLAKWIRDVGVDDPELQPNHAWRHTFKLVAERAGITERISDEITGHAQVTVGRGYGKPTLADMATALGRFPKFC